MHKYEFFSFSQFGGWLFIKDITFHGEENSSWIPPLSVIDPIGET